MINRHHKVFRCHALPIGVNSAGMINEVILHSKHSMITGRATVHQAKVSVLSLVVTK
jgi:hypothetical protein